LHAERERRMDSPMSSLDFRVMSLGFKIRDLVRPRSLVLKEAAIRPGAKVLDYGCGPGGYTVPLARSVGPAGHVYALDLNPAAIRVTERLATRRKIDNLTTILSDRNTGLPDASVDVVLLYDTFHHLSKPEQVLRELHRVLKKDGLLSFSDHHLKEPEIVAGVTSSGLFALARKGKKTYSFTKRGQ
jgi:ubiquinone/menaquinone biosynthesis C-methylase UbiE